MNPREAAHRERPWRVHSIAPDFDLEDLWGFDLAGIEPKSVGEFLGCFWGAFDGLSASWLAKTRLRIGRTMKWDENDFALAIPGCTEKTIYARLTPGDRERSLTTEDAPSPVPSPVVKTVYIFEDEALYEVSNDTIHALLHVAIVGATATLAVYVKSRGSLSRAYMAAIWPARHVILYPALIRRIESRWRSAQAKPAPT